MRLRPFIYLLIAGLFPAANANDLPPGDVTPHELLSPREHAELYLNLVTIICRELIPLQDSVTDSASAAAIADKVEKLHSRLNMAVSHMRHNPDMSNEVSKILRDAPAREKALRELNIRFNNSLRRCRETGLINSREFNRALLPGSICPTEQP